MPYGMTKQQWETPHDAFGNVLPVTTMPPLSPDYSLQAAQDDARHQLAAQGFARSIANYMAPYTARFVGAQGTTPGHWENPGHLAIGTDFWKGGYSWVGERGPELMRLPRGTAVYPNSAYQYHGGDPPYGAYPNSPTPQPAQYPPYPAGVTPSMLQPPSAPFSPTAPTTNAYSYGSVVGPGQAGHFPSPYYSGSVGPRPTTAAATPAPNASPSAYTGTAGDLNRALYGDAPQTPAEGGAAEGGAARPQTAEEVLASLIAINQANADRDYAEKVRQFNEQQAAARMATNLSFFNTLGAEQPYAVTNEAGLRAAGTPAPFHLQREGVRQDTPGHRGSDQVARVDDIAKQIAGDPNGPAAQAFRDLTDQVSQNDRTGNPGALAAGGNYLTDAQRAYYQVLNRLRNKSGGK